MDRLIDIEIINEQDYSKKKIKFKRFGTYYELAEQIQYEGINLPEYFDLIIANGDKLKPSDTEILDFKDIPTIKVRDVTENESTSIDFNNVECGKLINIEVRRKGDKWRTVTKGINLFGECKNEKCEAYKLEVVQMIKDSVFDATINNGFMECPMCGCKCKLDNIGFYNCYYNFYGSKFDEETDEIKKFGINIPDFSNADISEDNMVNVNGKDYKVFKTKIGNASYFDGNSGKVKYIKLVFQVKKFGRSKKRNK
jgi:hypothetical protein